MIRFGHVLTQVKTPVSSLSSMVPLTRITILQYNRAVLLTDPLVRNSRN